MSYCRFVKYAVILHRRSWAGEGTPGGHGAISRRTEVKTMAGNSRLSIGRATSQAASNDEPASSDLRKLWLELVTYSLLAGMLAVVIGATVSFAFKGNTRVIVLCVMSSVFSLMLGLAHGSYGHRACRAAYLRLLSWLVS